MKPRYTKRVREEAALICAIAASGGGVGGGLWSYVEIRRHLGIPDTSESSDLASSAWTVTSFRYDDPFSPMRDAEAHSLIMDGWSPGDPL